MMSMPSRPQFTAILGMITLVVGATSASHYRVKLRVSLYYGWKYQLHDYQDGSLSPILWQAQRQDAISCLLGQHMLGAQYFVHSCQKTWLSKEFLPKKFI
jgi:hypothetical protein